MSSLTSDHGPISSMRSDIDSPFIRPFWIICSYRNINFKRCQLDSVVHAISRFGANYSRRKEALVGAVSRSAVDAGGNRQRCCGAGTLRGRARQRGQAHGPCSGCRTTKGGALDSSRGGCYGTIPRLGPQEAVRQVRRAVTSSQFRQANRHRWRANGWREPHWGTRKQPATMRG
jgi:hypothetical protein